MIFLNILYCYLSVWLTFWNLQIYHDMKSRCFKESGLSSYNYIVNYIYYYYTLQTFKCMIFKWKQKNTKHYYQLLGLKWLVIFLLATLYGTLLSVSLCLQPQSMETTLIFYPNYKDIDYHKKININCIILGL